MFSQALSLLWYTAIIIQQWCCISAKCSFFSLVLFHRIAQRSHGWKTLSLRFWPTSSQQMIDHSCTFFHVTSSLYLSICVHLSTYHVCVCVSARLPVHPSIPLGNFSYFGLIKEVSILSYYYKWVSRINKLRSKCILCFLFLKKNNVMVCGYH